MKDQDIKDVLALRDILTTTVGGVTAVIAALIDWKNGSTANDETPMKFEAAQQDSDTDAEEETEPEEMEPEPVAAPKKSAPPAKKAAPKARAKPPAAAAASDDDDF